MHNIYEDESYAEIRAMLHVKLVDIREKYGDSDALTQENLENYLKAKQLKKVDVH